MSYLIPTTAGIQRFTPTTGQTISPAQSDSPLMVCIMLNAGLLGSLTIDLPNGKFDGQLCRITFNAAITILSVTNSSGSGVLGGLSAALVNGFAGWVWDNVSSVWRRCA